MKIGKKHFVLQTWRDHVREAYLDKRRQKFQVFRALKAHAKASQRMTAKIVKSAKVRFVSKIFDAWKTITVTHRIVKDFRKRQDLNTLQRAFLNMRIVLLSEARDTLRGNVLHHEGVLRSRKEAAQHQSEVYLERIRQLELESQRLEESRLDFQRQLQAAKAENMRLE